MVWPARWWNTLYRIGKTIWSPILTREILANPFYKKM